MWARPVTLVNARVLAADGGASSVRFGARILEIDGQPRRGDAVVDLEGAFVLPALINAHDHLELNHYGRLKCRERYGNALEWINDLRPRLQGDGWIRARTAQPLAARLFIGGLKNLLAGTTTVAHHNPRYREIGRAFPVRVVRRYGWAHSFALERSPVGARGEVGGDVCQRYRTTPARLPFIVHLAEGVDAAAAGEFGRLESARCVESNTVLVHGVALTKEEWKRMVWRGASLVWCPASNAFLFGRTPPVRQFLDVSDAARGHLCLGSDSRITGARDLLDELRAAAVAAPLTSRELLRLVTKVPARILDLPDLGRVTPGARADLIVLPSARNDHADALLDASRRDLTLVTMDGQPMVGAALFAPVFQARGVHSEQILVDGVPRLAEARLARAIARNPIEEPGVTCV